MNPMKLDNFLLKPGARDGGRWFQPVPGWWWKVRSSLCSEFKNDIQRRRERHARVLRVGGPEAVDLEREIGAESIAATLVVEVQPIDGFTHTEESVLELLMNPDAEHIFEAINVYAGTASNFYGEIPEAELGNSWPGRTGSPATETPSN